MSNDLLELIDVAPTGIATQSSIAPWSEIDDAQLVVSDTGTEDFANHTGEDDKPWWQLDLHHPYFVYEIIIENRQMPHFALRNRFLTVECSVDGNAWELLHAGISIFGGGHNGTPMRLELGGRTTVRFLRLSLPHKEFLHLLKVKVLVTKESKLVSEFWSQHNFNSMIFRSLEGKISWRPFYQLVPAGVPELDKIVGLKVEFFGRFGNKLMQITNALHIAKQLNLSYVWAINLSLDTDEQIIQKDGITIFPQKSQPVPGYYLEGCFFNADALNDAVFAGYSNVVRYQLAQEYVLPLSGLDRVAPHILPSIDREKELVIHIRSGDVFSIPAPAHYVQPPLSYYTSIVEDMLHSGKINSVCIVMEDRINPCANGLVLFLEEKNIPFHIQSGSLKEDLAYLRSAKHLVFGFGTFGFGVCLLAQELDTVYVFDMGNCYNSLPNIKNLILVVPREGKYIARGSWDASREQIQLMLDFKKEDLLMTRIEG